MTLSKVDAELWDLWMVRRNGRGDFATAFGQGDGFCGSGRLAFG